MMKALIIASLLLMSGFAYAAPRHGVASAAGGGGGPPPTVDNSCGVTTNNWCIQSNGWTKITATQGTTGTCNNSSGTRNGTCIVGVTAAGNNTTCAAEIPPAGFTTEQLSTWVPVTPCQTPAKAQTLLRNSQPDWLVMKKGETFSPLNDTNGILVNKNGKSVAEPMLISAYGSGLGHR